MKQRIQLSDHFGYGRLIRFTIPSILMMTFTSDCCNRCIRSGRIVLERCVGTDEQYFHAHRRHAV